MPQKSTAPKLAWRIGLPMARDGAAFEELRELLRAHRSVVDEVAFFETISHHLYLPLEYYIEVADVLKRRMATLRNDGIASVGINVLTTIGHVNEGWDVFPPLPFQAMIGHNGVASKSCACPNTQELRRFVAAKYALMAKADPDFIWVDDDIRIQSHGVEYPCFCPTCLALFAKTTGRKRNRLALVKALNSPAGGKIRAAWTTQNARTLDSLLAHVEAAVHRVRPKIEMGLMTSGPLWNSYSGYDPGRWLKSLKACKVRPGGGFYSDERPIDMLNKALEIGRQCVSFPKRVHDNQYELENFPYGPMGKSHTAVIAECTLALAVGCNGIAFNALGALTGPKGDALQAKTPLLRSIANARPFWESLLAYAADYPVGGYRPAWHPAVAARRVVRKGEDWFEGSYLYEIGKANGLARLGLPLSPARSGGGVILSGRNAESFTDKELRAMLAGPVLMDAFALETLTARGLGSLTGVRLAGWQDNGVAERLTNDPLNAPMEGGIRDIRSEFWGDVFMNSARLAPLSKSVRVLSVLETYLGARRDPCVTAYENKLGGRVVVFGHAPWRYLDVKRAPILNAADWAMRGRLPLRIHEDMPVIPIVRLSPDRKRGAIVLLHAGLDDLEQVTVELRVPVGRVTLATPGRPARELKPRRTRNGWTITLRNVRPWQVLALLVGPPPRGVCSKPASH